MFSRSTIFAMTFLLAATTSFAHTISEKEVADLAARPDSWFLQQVGGKRITLDGQTLDLRLQYLLRPHDEPAASKEKAPAKPEPEIDYFGPEHAAQTRREAGLDWIRKTKPGPELASMKDEKVPSRGGGSIPVRIYHPKASGKLPVLVYYHGGGWLFGDIAAVDRTMRRLADEARVIIISTEYRLAPEHPYPAAWEDSEDAFDWAVKNAERLGGDKARICVGGDSAGGNLSVAVTTRTQRAGKPSPACQLLYYGAFDNRSVPEVRKVTEYESARIFWSGFGLDVPFTELVLRDTFPGQDLSNPEISPNLAKDFSKTPPTIVAAAGFDPLRDFDRVYAQKLKKAGVTVKYMEYPSLIHGFMQHTAIVPEADRAASETAKAFEEMVKKLGKK